MHDLENLNSRRDFTLALLGLGGLLVPGTGQAADPSTPGSDPLVELLKQRYGKHLNEEQVKQLATRLRLAQGTLERLKRVSLTNADEPAFVFTADLP